MKALTRGLVALGVLAAVGVAAGVASGQSFSGGTITIPASGSQGNAAPYPSTIAVSGVPVVTRVQVVLSGLTHSFPSDLDVLLVGPGGQSVVLMSDSGGSGDVAGVTLTFVDGFGPLPTGQITSGLYAPTPTGTDAFPEPAPAAPHGTALSVFDGLSGNGTWSLYIVDDASSDVGTLGSWTLRFNDAVVIPPQPGVAAFTYQGRLEAAGEPVSGTADFEFTGYTASVGTDPSNVLLQRTARSGVVVEDGLFTVTLPIDRNVVSDRDLWLEVAVRSPAGSGEFTTLTPRVRATPAIQAVTALQLVPGRVRVRGDSGTSANSPGILFASPIGSPTDRALVGMLNDSNVGFFTANWNLLVHSNGNTVLGDASGNAPPERLTVSGNVQINTGATSGRLSFGGVGNFAATAENSDAMFFQRTNPLPNASVLRLNLGDDSGGGSGDAFVVTTTGDGTSFTERFRFQADGNASKPGGGSWAALSDPRAKHDVVPLVGTLDRLLSLRGYSFLYNDDRIASGVARPGTQIGLMADEVARVFPDWVSTDGSGTRYVTERATTALMVEALRDLRAEKDAQVASLHAEVAAARAEAARRDAENAELKARLAALEAAIVRLTNTK
jgi:subtilisin-like proprotein convertase family protein